MIDLTTSWYGTGVLFAVSTTTLKLPDDLKKRVIAAAQQLGKTLHAFMIDAIEKDISAAEAKAKLIAEAAYIRETMLKDGKRYKADSERLAD